MANKYMKMCSVSLVIGEIQLYTIGYDHIATSVTKMNKTDDALCWCGVGPDPPTLLEGV